MPVPHFGRNTLKKILVFLSILVLLLPDLASAQGRPHRDGGHGRPGAGGPPHAGRPGGGGGPPNPGRPGQGHRPGGGGGHIRPPRPTPGRPSIQPVRPVRPQPGRPNRPPHRHGVRPPHFRPIRGPAFRYPHGYSYRRWTAGLFLPGLFLSSLYYINDYAGLGIDPPPPGYRWVRYGPDLLLVQIGTRRIADVIYNAFY